MSFQRFPSLDQSEFSANVQISLQFVLFTLLAPHLLALYRQKVRFHGHLQLYTIFVKFILPHFTKYELEDKKYNDKLHLLKQTNPDRLRQILAVDPRYFITRPEGQSKYQEAITSLNRIPGAVTGIFV